MKDSVADVRKKKQTPSSTIPSLQVTKENEFDRTLLLVLSHSLTDKGIPEEFLKSRYFTLRPQLVQLYQEDPTFRARLEEALDRVEEEVARDYKMLVNETNRTYLSRYPFEEVAPALGIQSSVGGFSASKNKLDTIKQHSDHSRCHTEIHRVAAAERNVHSNTRVQVHQRPTFYARSARQNDQRPGVCSIGPEKRQPLLSKSQSYTGGKVNRMKNGRSPEQRRYRACFERGEWVSGGVQLRPVAESEKGSVLRGEHRQRFTTMGRSRGRTLLADGL